MKKTNKIMQRIMVITVLMIGLFTVVLVGLPARAFGQDWFISPQWSQVPNSAGVRSVANMPNGTLLGVGSNLTLYTRASLNSPWVQVPNSGSVISASATTSGKILGVGSNNQLYVRDSLYESWVNIPNSGAIIDVAEMPNGSLVAVGTDHNLYTRATIQSTWVEVPNSGKVISVRAANTGKLFGAAADNELYVRDSLYSEWTRVADSKAVVQAVELSPGNLVSVGVNGTLYTGKITRPDLTLTITSVKCISPSTGTDDATKVLIGSIGALVGVGATVATAGAAAPTMGALLAAGASAGGTGLGLTETLGKQFGGTDDIFFKVNNIKVWPGSGDYVSISSQEVKNVGYSINFMKGRGPMVELLEWDSASDDDFMGRSSFGTADSEKPEDEYVFFHKDEGSFYQVKIKITRFGQR